MNKGYLLSIIALFSFFNTQAQDVYWPESSEELNTGANSSYFISTVNYDDTQIGFGYRIGAFYINDEGDLECGGYANCSLNAFQMVVWGDDATTLDKSGFTEGEEITWLALKIYPDSTTFTATIEAVESASTYSTNGLNFITTFSISSSF